ncbi:MAG: pyridoxal 5'-phosphate synthase glutaminase subunit PdxT [Candidatus Altiarchaeota archaeon]
MSSKALRIGVLAIQGNVDAHTEAMREALKKKKGVIGEVVEVKKKEHFHSLDALLIPGGESTTIGKLLDHYKIDKEIKDYASTGKPILATCAGMILLAKEGGTQVEKTKQPLLGILDIRVNRNAFGRQRESFEAALKIKGIADDYPAVFIRAPTVEKIWGKTKAIAEHKGKIVGIKQENIIALSFHPELTIDTRVHEYILSLQEKKR